MSELKPCPFCGVTGETEVDCGGSKDRWWAKCYNPKCLYDVSTNIFDTEADAIAAWNTRAPASPSADIAAMISAVEESLSQPRDVFLISRDDLAKWLTVLRSIPASPSAEDVERVARALFMEEWKNAPGSAQWEQEKDKEYWRGSARAALAAMGRK